MINNPVRNIHTDYVANDVFKPKDANALAMSIPFDFVITKERVDEYREKHGYTQETWMDVGALLWEDYDDTPDYTCGGRTAVHILINLHTTIEDRFDFGSWLTSLASNIQEVHIHSLSSYRAKGASLNIFYHTHGTKNFVLFDDSNLYRSRPLHVGSFALWYGEGVGYPQWHFGAPFIYEQCVDGPLPEGNAGEPIEVKQENWLSNGVGNGGSGGGGSILAIVDTDFTGHYYKNGSEDGGHEEVTFDTSGTGAIPFRGVGVLRGNGLESIDSIFSFGAGEDKWFDGDNANGQFRALSVDSAKTIDIYTWDVIDSWAITNLTKRYKNLHGHVVSWIYGTGNPPPSNSAGKPLTIDGASLEEDKVYEIRVHYMDVGYRNAGGWGTPNPCLYQEIQSLPNPVSPTDPLKISISTYTFTRKDIETTNADVCGESDFCVQFKNAEGSYYPIAKWAIQSDSPSTIGTSFNVVMKYNLKNTVASSRTLLPEIGFGSTIFFRHGMYVYVMTY